MSGEQSNSFMARAIQLSLENVRLGRGGPFAALVVKDGRVISEGTNLVTSENDPTAHAEIVAIRRACLALATFQLTGCEIYASCEPCPMCLGAIYWARLDRLFYACQAEDAARAGFDDSLIRAELSLPHQGRRIPMLQLMREEGLAAFEAWMANPNKIPY
jgi:tRNA(Arg) A34 adenosine deaminase TadA